MLLEPTEKFKAKILQTWYYKNCPRYVFNSMIQTMVKGEDGRKHKYDDIFISLKSFLLKWEYPIDDIEQIIQFHTTVDARTFSNHINLDSYAKNIPEHVDAKTREIQQWERDNTPQATIWRPSPMTPTYPYLKTFQY